ncbi:MAG: DUF3244 domain-containing protein [Bacteroidaceae bacterium]|nr:DUF3244 domain-containing protein [Bacteroidaceae bacterium]
MNKKVLLIFLMLLSVISVFADQIPLARQYSPNDRDERERYENLNVRASLDNTTIFVNYSQIISSSIEVVDLETGIVVAHENCDSTSFTDIDISILTNGHYKLQISAFGYLWVGYFDVD